jgi:hypothetical protein
MSRILPHHGSAPVEFAQASGWKIAEILGGCCRLRRN